MINAAPKILGKAAPWNLVLPIGAVLFCFSAAGMLLARTIPVHRVETTEHRIVTKRVIKTEKREHVIQIPVRNYPPLTNSKDACRGAPVVIKQLDVTGKRGDDAVTWFLVQPAGDDYIVACRRAGSYKDYLTPGQLVRIWGTPDEDKS